MSEYYNGVLALRRESDVWLIVKGGPRYSQRRAWRISFCALRRGGAGFGE